MAFRPKNFILVGIGGVTLAALSAASLTDAPYYGNVLTAVADVTGDLRADAIAVNSDKIGVRRSNSPSSQPHELWTDGPFFGDRGTFFADVTGDQKADAIAVNEEGNITVRRSDGSRFRDNEPWSSGPFWGNKGTAFANVDGELGDDAVAVNADGIAVLRSGLNTFPSEHAVFLSEGFWGSRGTAFADVDGDGSSDAIAINSTMVAVRRSLKNAFGPRVDWITTDFNGDVENVSSASTARTSDSETLPGTVVFARVNADTCADAIAVRKDGIRVRLSNCRDAFGPEQLWFAEPFYGSLATILADIDGDSDADVIAVNKEGMAALVNVKEKSRFARLPPPPTPAQSQSANTNTASITCQFGDTASITCPNPRKAECGCYGGFGTWSADARCSCQGTKDPEPGNLTPKYLPPTTKAPDLPSPGDCSALFSGESTATLENRYWKQTNVDITIGNGAHCAADQMTYCGRLTIRKGETIRFATHAPSGAHDLCFRRDRDPDQPDGTFGDWVHVTVYDKKHPAVFVD